jgi:hypothetical protein
MELGCVHRQRHRVFERLIDMCPCFCPGVFHPLGMLQQRAFALLYAVLYGLPDAPQDAKATFVGHRRFSHRMRYRSSRPMSSTSAFRDNSASYREREMARSSDVMVWSFISAKSLISACCFSTAVCTALNVSSKRSDMIYSRIVFHET